MESDSINYSQLKESFPIANFPGGGWFEKLDKGIVVNLIEGAPLLIRWMFAEDIPMVCELERQIFPSPWPYESFIYELYNRNNNISIVGQIQNQVIAYAVSYLVVDEVHISNLAVAPNYQRLKIGETLLWISLQMSREKKSRIAHLEVRKNNLTAIALYQKYGFQVVGVRKNYYQNENEDALLMSCNLATESTHGVV